MASVPRTVAKKNDSVSCSGGDRADGDRYRDGSPFERLAGYSRAARRAGIIAVSGTAAIAPDGTALHPGDTYAQTNEALRHALAAVKHLGGTSADVVRRASPRT